MLRTIRYWLIFWLYQVVILPFRWRCQGLKRKGELEKLQQAATRRGYQWARLLLALSGSHIQRTGLEHIPADEAVLYVSNHQGEFDIPLILSSSPHPTAFVAKTELRKIPFVGFWMQAIGCEFIDRDNRRQMVAVAKNTAEKLQQGLSMVIFPEGTRSNQDDMAPFKKGSLSLAERAGVKIVPVAVKHSHRMKKPGSPLIQKTNVCIHFFPPIDPSTLDADEKDNLHIKIHDMIQERVWAAPRSEQDAEQAKQE